MRVDEDVALVPHFVVAIGTVIYDTIEEFSNIIKSCVHSPLPPLGAIEEISDKKERGF